MYNIPEILYEDETKEYIKDYFNIIDEQLKTSHRAIIIFYTDSKRIDFKTKADWHEHQILLKAAFPVDINTSEINCDIQFGNIKRSLKRDTSWEKAKFECCAHKWIDISEDNGKYGVAVLNDSKYGYDAKEKLMRLTLIKSGIFPNPNADQGEHEFTYSLFPHSGDFREGKVIEEARKLNEEAHYYVSESSLKSENTFKVHHTVDTIIRKIIDVETEGVFVEAIKQAEDSKDIIIRLYEGYGRKTKCIANIFKNIKCNPKSIEECSLLEDKIAENKSSILYDDITKKLIFELEPYEVKSIKIGI